MPLEFSCPACERKLTAPFAAAGQSGNCKFCRARIIAPAAPGRPATLLDAPADSPSDPPYQPETPYAAGDIGGPPRGSSTDSGHLSATMPPDVKAQAGVAKAMLYGGTPAIADFWKRALGFGIDLLLITGMVIGLHLLLTRKLGIDNTVIWVAKGDEMKEALTYTGVLFWAKVLYGGILEGSPLQATPGKLILGMKACCENGAPLSYAGAIWRNFCKWATIGFVGFVPVLGMFPYLIFLYAMNNRYTQALHDLLASTVVAERSY